MPLQRIGVDLPQSPLGTELLAILRARGLSVEVRSFDESAGNTGEIATQVLSDIPTGAEAAALGVLVAAHSATGRPPVLYMPAVLGKRGRADELAGCAALLRARGAILTSDPQVWVECVVLLAAYGAPSGTRIAIVAPPESWLTAASGALQREAERLGERFTPSTTTEGATDAVLADASTLRTWDRKARHFVVPVSGRPQVCNDKPTLVGLAAALSAIELAGQASLRIAAGDGPADSPSELAGIDTDRLGRQLDKLHTRAGDHECKVMLASYGLDITRQAVATTPSAATRIAKKAGFPVELKAWGPEQPSEDEGAIVLRGIATASEVRRAYASICSRMDCEAVIVRETPMRGREVQVSIRQQGQLGLQLYLKQEGLGETAAAMAPLRPVDAHSMARQVVASRSEDGSPDWEALENLLLRASHLVADNARVISLDLPRVVVGTQGEGVVIVDAKATLET